MTVSTELALVLDNPVWNALTTNHAHFASGTDLAKRYPVEVAPFVGLADRSEAAFRDLRQIVGQGDTFALWGLNLPSELPGWTTRFAFNVLQMVSQQPIPDPVSAETVVDLTAADVPDMLELIKLTEPGPFLRARLNWGITSAFAKRRSLWRWRANECIRPAAARSARSVRILTIAEKAMRGCW